jgi:apolipoprotein N-acyltransferase
MVSYHASRITHHASWFGRLLWSLLGAAAWVALEMVRARLFGDFPWDFIGVSQFKMVPLIQITSVAGVYGISFLVVWTSLSLYSAVRLIFYRPDTRLIWQVDIILPFVAVVALFVFGFARMNRENPPASVLRVTLVQPSIPQTLIWNPTEDDKRFQELLAQSQAALANQTDLLLWPESAVPATDVATCRVISRFAQSNRVWLILNGEDAEYLPDTTNYFNAAYLIGPDGQWLQVYHKRKLVIFGEYVPLVCWLPFVKYLTPIISGWTPGDKPATFELNRWGESLSSPNQKILRLDGVSPRQTIKTSPLICYEDTFPELARAAANDDMDFLVNLTNDGWFRRSAEQWQHMASAVFRAVENGLPLVRCANNGITCWIDASGRVREIFRDKAGSVYGTSAMTVEIPIVERRTPTFYNRHGDWFGWNCIGVTILLIGFTINKRRKQL